MRTYRRAEVAAGHSPSTLPGKEPKLVGHEPPPEFSHHWLAADLADVMKPRKTNWLTRLSDLVDKGLGRLQRRCPKCQGNLHREFSILDKVGLYFPIPHTVHAHHQCARCHARFRSYRTLTDVFLTIAWVSGLVVLGDYWPLALAGTIAWLGTWHFMKGSASRGEADTVSAGVVIAILWVLALVFGDLDRGTYLTEHRLILAAILLVLTVAFVWMVLVLDRYTNFGLKEVDT